MKTTPAPTGLRKAAALLCLCAAFGYAPPAPAQAPPDCQSFDWPLEREGAWFAAPNLPTIESGGQASTNGAVAIRLRPNDEVGFATPPERAPKAPGSFGAKLDVAAPAKPGLYQITLSDDAWIDVVQGGARLKSAAFTGRKACPGLRKSVRFELKGTPFTIQVSGAATDRLKLAVGPVEGR
ncbi:MAG TPA: hypothetical protein VK446_16065 [Methylocystis sp.]|nr:hypothetical protein [Methylocystis sp.]